MSILGNRWTESSRRSIWQLRPTLGSMEPPFGDWAVPVSKTGLARWRVYFSLPRLPNLTTGFKHFQKMLCCYCPAHISSLAMGYCTQNQFSSDVLGKSTRKLQFAIRVGERCTFSQAFLSPQLKVWEPFSKGQNSHTHPYIAACSAKIWFKSSELWRVGLDGYFIAL